MGLRVELVENGPAVEVTISADVGAALAATGFLDARPVIGTRLWSVIPQSKVGAFSVGGLEVHIAPKVEISRLLFLLEHAQRRVRWQSSSVEVDVASDLLTAVVEVFERATRTALLPGLLQGYRTVDEALPFVRGRIRENEQLRRRFGLPLPVENRFDDFTVDIPENRLLLSAVLACRRLPGLSRSLRHRLLDLDRALAGVTPPRPGYLEPWLPTRLNARLHDALHLAAVILRHASFEPSGAGLTVSGFIIDMAKVFEDFVCASLGRELSSIAGRSRNQDPWTLDTANQVQMYPDLVWYADTGKPVAVIDAKYKAEKPDGFPNADLYQLLAYCTAMRLPIGHLVYAKGNETGREYTVREAGVQVRAHTLDLALDPGDLLRSIGALAREIAASSLLGSSGQTGVDAAQRAG